MAQPRRLESLVSTTALLATSWEARTAHNLLTLRRLEPLGVLSERRHLRTHIGETCSAFIVKIAQQQQTPQRYSNRSTLLYSLYSLAPTLCVPLTPLSILHSRSIHGDRKTLPARLLGQQAHNLYPF